MYIVHVFIELKPAAVEEFKAASIDNAANSLKEPGVARFDLIQEVDDPSRFVLLEVYRSKNDAALHKETKHYDRWRETVESMMVEPRSRIIYQNIHPSDTAWQ